MKWRYLNAMPIGETDPYGKGSERKFVYAGTIGILVCICWLFLFKGYTGLEESAGRILNKIHESERLMNEEMKILSDLSDSTLVSYLSDRANYYESYGLSFYVESDSSLQAWSTNEVPEIDQLADHVLSGPCILLRNGFYLISQEKIGQKTVHGLFLIKNEYNYQNRYLTNNYPSHFNLDSSPEITFIKSEGSIPIVNLKGEQIFHLVAGKDGAFKPVLLWSIILFLGIFLLLKGLFAVIYSWRSDYVILLLTIGTILMIRIITLFLEQPAVVSIIPGFSPEIYASSRLFPSINDFLLNTFFIFLCSYFSFKWIEARNRNIPFPMTIVLMGLFLIAGHFVNDLFIQLISDSVLNFNIANFFDLNAYSMMGIIALGLLLVSMYFAARALVIFYREDTVGPGIKWKWVILLVFVLLLIGVNHILHVVDMVLVLWAWVLLAGLVLFNSDRSGLRLFSQAVFGLVLISFYSAYMFEKYVSIKNRSNLELIAGQILDGTDTDAEYRFIQFKNEMESDSLLWSQDFEREQSVIAIKERLERNYFRGFWSKYDLNVSWFNTNGNEVASTAGIVDRRRQDVEERMSPANGSSSLSDLLKTKQAADNVSYMARMLLPDSSTIYIELAQRIIPEELGFPELLLEREDMYEEELSEFSIAQYHKGGLIASSGEYEYKMVTDFRDHPSYIRNGYYVQNGFDHFPFQRGEDTFIISGVAKTAMGHVTTFTYLFTLFGFMMLIGLLIERVIVSRNPLLINLQNKIQMLIIGIIVASLLIFGMGAYYYIISQNKEKNEKLLSEKVESVLIELSHKLEKEKAINDKQKMEKYLLKFSKVFFTDINLYDLDGELKASSRPQLFNRGVISTQMNPVAFNSLSYQDDSKFIHEENIGSLRYLSAYVPFRNSQNEVLAYLNLPYFAKQGELEDELSAFVVAVVNVLVLLFALSTIVALIFSNWITRPLKILRENLAAISLDTTNRQISYSGSDEIASLVKEYNDKVRELEENAELLAKSERESAWREMAKQVAHEIKNPLTPMKLSIQYLQRSWEHGSEDWEDKFKRSTNTLIEQIDTLSGIATAFSDFAKMPHAAKERFDLILLLRQVVELFAGQPDMEVLFSTELIGEAIVVADRDQLTRLFNNLIKNAVQSIPEEQEGKVSVQLTSAASQFIIEVKDNGIGIAEEMIDRIFEPNFTTKTTGTGLGLAMCKNIVGSADGDIWLKTKWGQGTSFFVSLPRSEPQ